MRRPACLHAALAAVALTLACANPDDPRPVVAVSVLPQKYVVDRIAGDLVRCEVMLPPGARPTTHAPDMAQLSVLSRAALYVKVGHPNFPFEATWLAPLLAENAGLHVVDGSGGVPDAGADPHNWLAPSQMRRLVAAVASALEELLPAERELLRRNAVAFDNEIGALDAELRTQLASRRGRTFLVFHPGWGSFAQAYGLEQLAIEHDHKEPGAHQLAELIARARAERIARVFVQPQFDPASARTLAREIGAQIEPLDPLAYDWPANLRHAARVLIEALPE